MSNKSLILPMKPSSCQCFFINNFTNFTTCLLYSIRRFLCILFLRIGDFIFLFKLKALVLLPNAFNSFYSSSVDGSKGIPVRRTPLVSMPPRPFSPVRVLRSTSHTFILSIKGVKLILATI